MFKKLLASIKNVISNTAEKVRNYIDTPKPPKTEALKTPEPPKREGITTPNNYDHLVENYDDTFTTFIPQEQRLTAEQATEYDKLFWEVNEIREANNLPLYEFDPSRMVENYDVKIERMRKYNTPEHLANRKKILMNSVRIAIDKIGSNVVMTKGATPAENEYIDQVLTFIQIVQKMDDVTMSQWLDEAQNIGHKSYSAIESLFDFNYTIEDIHPDLVYLTIMNYSHLVRS